MSEILNSAQIVPIAGIAMVLCISIGSMFKEAYSKRLRAEQRMAMVSQGKSAEEIERLLHSGKEEDEKYMNDPMRSLAIARRTGIILISAGIGLSVFFVVLWMILGVRAVLSGAAAGLLPLAIGIGFFVDYHLQQRELSRFGLEVDTDRA